jgi:hypothetical protein
MPRSLSSLTRLPRIALLVTSLAVAFSAAAGTGIASAKTPHAAKKAHAAKKLHVAKKAHVAGSLPAEGIFDNCEISQTLNTCEQNLQAMHQAGLQVAVLAVGGNSLSDLTSYATYAQNLGMSIMWELNDPGFWGGEWTGSSATIDYPSFSTACDCTASNQVLDYMIKWLAALPATYGYYAADDSVLAAGQKGGLTQYVNRIKALDPKDMVMVGSSPSQGSSYASTGATIGNEIYPETTNNLMPAGSNLAAWDSVEQSASQAQGSASQHGASSAFILQAFSFGDNLIDGQDVGVCTASMSEATCASKLHYPSAATQLQLRNEVLEHAHPKLIIWYTFSQARDGNHWASLRNVINAPFPATATAARAARAKNRRVAHSKRSTKGHKQAAKHTVKHAAKA